MTIAELSDALAQELGQYRREGNSIYFPSVTDKDEPEHRVDSVVGALFCTCRGFIRWRHCDHVRRARRLFSMETNRTTALTVPDAGQRLPMQQRSPQQLAIRLAQMVEERGLVATFFKDVMEEGHDYGVIPGTDKPTLFKPGAEKLAELYGYAPVVRDRQENVDYDTGFYRVVITMGLVNKDTGELVAEGVGECNTREARYFYRWVSANRIPEGINKDSLKSEERSSRNGKYRVYRLENDDLFTLWNTVLKMSKKRALVDAVLSATRSSGIFGRSAQEIQTWIDAEYTDITESDEEDDADQPPQPKQDVQAPPRPSRPTQPTPPKPESSACEHPADARYMDETTTLMTCRICGAVLEEPPADAPRKQPSLPV